MEDKERINRLNEKIKAAKEALKGTPLSGMYVQEGDGIRFWVANPDLEKKKEEPCPRRGR